MENDLAILEVEDLEQEEDVEVEEKVPKEVMEKVEEAKHIQEHHKEETEEEIVLDPNLVVTRKLSVLPVLSVLYPGWNISMDIWEWE